MIKLSVLIITKDEEKNISSCLKSISFADEKVVVDSGSSDRTVEIAQKEGAKVFVHQFKDFAQQRNFALAKAKGDWVLYLDADERVTADLGREILETIKEEKKDIYLLPRKNFYLGKAWPHIEKLERLFKKEALKGWQGELHESPIFEGSSGELKNFLLHHTHRDLSSMVQKTIEWSEVEAYLRLKAGHPKMSWWRFPRVMLTEFFNYYFRQGGWKVGIVGLIESLYQAFSIFTTYARLWELQNKDEKSF